MGKSKTSKVNINNLVAKHMEEFNRPATFVDRKKEMKRGKTKYKNKEYFQ